MRLRTNCLICHELRDRSGIDDQICDDQRMDSFVTWEGVVASAALLVSLYSLRQVRRAPAMARQRELRDQLRVMLEASAAQIKEVRSGIRRGAPDRLDAFEFMQPAQEISKLGDRLTGRGGRVSLVVAHLQAVAAHLQSVGAARSRNSTRELLGGSSVAGLSEELPEANVDIALRDLDDACKEAASVIADEIEELNRLESE